MNIGTSNETRIKKNSKEEIANRLGLNINTVVSKQYPSYLSLSYNKNHAEFAKNSGKSPNQKQKTPKHQQNIAIDPSKILARNKSRQKLSKVQSVFLAETERQRNTQRLNTEQLIPNFRQKYQYHQLIQQITHYKQSLDLKNKQIFYLSNQLVSVKDQYTQKILQLQCIISQNKRELTQLRYNGLKNKRQESQKGDKIVDECKRNYELQLKSMRETNEQLIKKINEQHNKDIENMEQKFKTILNLEKREKASIQELFAEKAKNFDDFIKKMHEENIKLQKQIDMKNQQNNRQSKGLDELKEKFKTFSDKASNQQKQMRIQIAKLNSEIVMLTQNNTALKKQHKSNNEANEREIKQLQQTSQLQKQQIKKLKALLLAKDKQIIKIISEANRNNSDRARKGEDANIDPIRVCNHEGLICQLERNLNIKNKENQQLKEQLTEWGKYIGFQRACSQRNSDLLNASQQALQSQQNFSSTLRKRVGKL